MTTNRLEAFSDGVLAIIITIMVLELKVPEGTSVEDLKPVLPTLIAYILSFIYVGIYWNNHHHFWHAVSKVSGSELWGNLHLLFWLSLLPFATAWLGENHLSEIPVAAYGLVLLMASVAWYILARITVKAEGKGSIIALAFHSDTKTILSMVAYTLAIGIAFYSPLISCILYALVAIGWLVPDRRIEKAIQTKSTLEDDRDLIA